MTASADVTVKEVKGALTVPNAAFRYAPPVAKPAQKTTGLLGMLFSSAPTANRGSSSPTGAAKDGFRSLYVLKGGQPTEIRVKTGVSDGDVTEVLEGPLAVGDLVVTAQTTGSRPAMGWVAPSASWSVCPRTM